MTPLFFWLVVTAFTLVLWAGGVVLEETERGRRVADRLIERITR